MHGVKEEYTKEENKMQEVETYKRTAGEGTISMSVFFEDLLERGRISVFDTTGIKQDRITDSFPSTYIIVDNQTKRAYLLGFRSHSEELNERNSQTVHNATFMHRLPAGFRIRGTIFAEDSSGYPYLPGLHPDARLLVTKDDDYISMDDTGSISSSRKTELMGERDSLMDRVIEFVTT